jgi:DNA-binding CsgD family transcriptional regulator
MAERITDAARLAAIAWPGRPVDVEQTESDAFATTGSECGIWIKGHLRAGEGMHAALLVLAGEAPATAPALDLSPLSRRERQVVDALYSGKRLRDIAAAFRISSHTVRNHIKSVNKKLGVRSQVELLARMAGRYV